jgi:hypothetical protein
MGSEGELPALVIPQFHHEKFFCSLKPFPNWIGGFHVQRHFSLGQGGGAGLGGAPR